MIFNFKDLHDIEVQIKEAIRQGIFMEDNEPSKKDVVHSSNTTTDDGFDAFRMMDAVPVSTTNFYKLFASKSHVLLYPGGMREALHRKGEEYKLFWPQQSEFIRMAARFGAKIIPFGAVGEDDVGQVVLDYHDLMKIPYFRAGIAELTDEAVQLRTDTEGEVANQTVHLPIILPKLLRRFYYFFWETN
ncbi:acyltransferase-like protein At1g54570, chloroplastic [Camellia sinensis]|uniref:acyltransferase-like protein At1g54570, chloroplastic n=1 Tax=Camellia sinensis TaxID=4442 RepID=UPI001035A449|nr:acyltransferase-like protein At1g54570, chloroplastic [Camellia sinensis]